VKASLGLALLLTACSGSPGDGLDGGDDGQADVTMMDDSSSSDAAGDTGNPGNDAGKDSGPGFDAGSVDNSDGFGAVRAACINEINKLRATESHAAYALWDTTAIDMCVDQQATYDQNANSPHKAWLNGVYPTCNGNAQDECLGYGNTVAGITACLDSMWNERLQSNCSSCPSCNGPKLTSAVIACQSTMTCDFYGKYGGECGHYINMSADYFTMAACGFSTVGTSKDWAAQNFK
jgi:hypothetical protein